MLSKTYKNLQESFKKNKRVLKNILEGQDNLYSSDEENPEKYDAAVNKNVEKEVR